MKPVLFLDFDRTLFDTDKLYEWIGDNRVERLMKLANGELKLPDLSTFLYPDTIEFLNWSKKNYRLVLVTYTINIVLQEKKISGTKIIPLLDDVIMVSGSGGYSGKGEAVRKYLHDINEPGWEHIFLDDSPQNIDEMKQMNPEIRCVRIDRVSHAQGMLHGDLLAPDYVVHDLNELKTVL